MAERTVAVSVAELTQLRDELRSLRDQLDELSRRRVDVSMAVQRVERMLSHVPRRTRTQPMHRSDPEEDG